MAEINQSNESGNFVNSEGDVYNMVDLLLSQGASGEPLYTGQSSVLNNQPARTGRMVASDGSVYNIIDLIQSMGEDPTTLKNSATGTDSITVLGQATTYAYGINIGYSSYLGGNYGTIVGARSSTTGINATVVGENASAAKDSVAIGTSSIASGNYSTAIGKSAQATAANAFALGTSSKAEAQGAIQIGGLTNNDPYTIYCGQYGYTNWKLLDLQTGLIPSGRLTMDTVVTSGSSNPVTSGAVYSIIGDVETLLQSI